jgi:flagellar biosynthesis chaperone FliJ
MPVTAALRRLLRVRNLEEEQHRLALESALADLHILEQALAHACTAERCGRARLASSASVSDPADRIGALVESASAARHAAALQPRIAAAQQEAVRLRQQFLSKRTERQQAETLIRERETQDAIAAGRRDQQGLDNWFSSRANRGRSPRSARSTRPSQKNFR